MKLDMPLALGLTGFGVYEVFSNYRDTAPSLTDLHMCPPGDVHYGQVLLDSDCLVGFVALLAAGTASWLAKTWLPLIVVGLTFGGVSLYYHAVYNRPKLASDQGGMENGNG